MKQLTISAIKADVGSLGGHTQPSTQMMKISAEMMSEAKNSKKIISYDVTHIGDDICLTMTHEHGSSSPVIHDLAWQTLLAATDVAKKEGLYGAGQDLLKDAPSGNVRGAGPGAAEITFDLDAPERRAESILIYTADKCGPGAYNFPLWAAFANPMFCMGLMLPKMKAGFRFTIIDMDHTGGDLVVDLCSPEDLFDMAILLRDENRFGIQAIYSRKYPDQQVASVSTDRLHTIAGVYTGKDDPVAIVRTQGIFPAPEEAISPYLTAHYVAGDARGSHHMPMMPVAINTAVTGAYCLPVVACVGYSVNKEGQLSERIDFFGNPAWDSTRTKAQLKGEAMRQQGFFGPAMLPIQELEYSEFRDSLADLQKRFFVR
jgi:fructose 1,6-bisphosphate aldolase/phosphatase